MDSSFEVRTLRLSRTIVLPRQRFIRSRHFAEAPTRRYPFARVYICLMNIICHTNTPALVRMYHQIADERLRGASTAAKAAAIETVEKSVLAEDEDDDFLLNSNFVQLNIGDQSPMVRASAHGSTGRGIAVTLRVI